jgi:hypothetical protein
MNARKWTAGAIMAAPLLAGPAWSADPATIEWKRVPTRTLTLFYPAQSTYQWLRTGEHPGSGAIAGGTSCVTCHNGQEEKLGEKLVKANRLEPTPIEGKNGSVKLNVQVAYDDQNAYFRFQWQTHGKQAGENYPYFRFDGKEWKPYGGPRLAAATRKGDQPAIYEDRLSMMIDDGAVPNFANQGCWLTCHRGERDTVGQPSAADVAANSFFQAIKRADVRKYLPASRSDDAASWDKGRSLEEIAKLKADGHFLDLIQWRAHRTNQVGMADDGYVLEWRNFDAGRNPFQSNLDGKTKQPRFMYDAGKTGNKGVAEADLRKGNVMVREQNAVPFDPNAGWKSGDLLPQYFLSAKEASGSAADNRNARGTWANGTWTVVWARPLKLANPDDKSLAEGKAYNFAFAVHDDNVTSRGHQVSFPVSVGFGAKATIEATKLK